jgi:hypothetical protein
MISSLFIGIFVDYYGPTKAVILVSLFLSPLFCSAFISMSLFCRTVLLSAPLCS